MTLETSWPWIAGLLAAAAALNTAPGMVAVLVLAEFGIREYLMARQRRLASGAWNG
jgi:hypothetical protein